jgi:two-component system OmpR family sensor kinase
MKLQTRLTALVSTIIILVSTALGLFTIESTKSIQIQRLDDRLNLAVTELANTKDDPLSLATLLADQSEFNFSVAYISAERDLTTIYESPADLSNTPSDIEITKALSRPITLDQNSGVRVRTLKLPDDQYLILSLSTKDIRDSTNELLKNLFLFTLIVLIIAIAISLLLFKRDNQLNKLIKALQTSQERMQTFIGDASHELRTPLTVIKGYFELMRKAQNTAEQRQPTYLDRIDAEVNRMEEMISDLLLITELDQDDQVSSSEINISNLLNEKIIDLMRIQEERNVDYKIDPNLQIKMSEHYAHQLLGNIFTNLKRHTPDNSKVEIKLSKDTGKTYLCIEDSGPGMPKEVYQDGILAFQRFDKSRSRETGGSGLGMTIIRKVIEKHHGEIKLSKSKFGGLKMEIWL